MSTHINIPNTPELAGDVKQLVRNMQMVLDDAARIKAIMATMTDDNQFVVLAANLGIASEADAATIQTLIAGVYLFNLNVGDYLSMLSRLG